MQFKLLQSQKKSLFYGGILLNILAGCTVLIIPFLVKDLMENPTGIWLRMFLLALFFILQITLNTAGRYLMSCYGESIVTSLRKQLFAHVISVKSCYLDEHKSGELAHMLMNNTMILQKFLTTSVVNVSTGLIVVIGSIIMLFLLDMLLTVTLLSGLLILFVALSLLSTLNRKKIEILNEQTSLLSGYVSEYIQQHKLLKLLTAQRQIMNKLNQQIQTTERLAVSNHRLDALIEPFVTVLLFVVLIILFSFGGYRVETGAISMGTLVSFFIYLFQTLTPFSQISMCISEYAKMKGSLKSLQCIFNQVTEEVCAEETKTLLCDKIIFENVYFSHGDKPVLCDITMTLHKNQKVALVGPSGAGKSTILSLITRLYDIDSGNIMIDNQSLDCISLNQLRREVAVVSQTTDLLATTIYENLVLGLSDGQINEEDIHSALVKAELWEDIQKMENGIDTQIGERGHKLSGGQQQRLQLARAILRKSRIILLDEPTSHLDSVTEQKITKMLRDIGENKIIVCVAHRLSTVVDADLIYFIENGRISGYGTHEELSQKHDGYRQFVEKQLICRD